MTLKQFCERIESACKIFKKENKEMTVLEESFKACCPCDCFDYENNACGKMDGGLCPAVQRAKELEEMQEIACAACGGYENGHCKFYMTSRGNCGTAHTIKALWNAGVRPTANNDLEKVLRQVKFERDIYKAQLYTAVNCKGNKI